MMRSVCHLRPGADHWCAMSKQSGAAITIGSRGRQAQGIAAALAAAAVQDLQPMSDQAGLAGAEYLHTSGRASALRFARANAAGATAVDFGTAASAATQAAAVAAGRPPAAVAQALAGSPGEAGARAYRRCVLTFREVIAAGATPAAMHTPWISLCAYFSGAPLAILRTPRAASAAVAVVVAAAAATAAAAAVAAAGTYTRPLLTST